MYVQNVFTQGNVEVRETASQDSNVLVVVLFTGERARRLSRM